MEPPPVMGTGSAGPASPAAPGSSTPRDLVGLIPAAGSGSRLGLGPKAFVEIGGQTLLRRAVELLRHCADRVLVGVPPTALDRARADAAGLAEVHPGSGTRTATIRLLFDRCPESLVVIHDVVRPFVDRQLLARVIDAAAAEGAAAACMRSRVPLVGVSRGLAATLIAKERGWLVQGPLAFHREVLERVLAFACARGAMEATPVELALQMGLPVRVVECDDTNLKITTDVDLEIARRVLAPRLDRDSGGLTGRQPVASATAEGSAAQVHTAPTAPGSERG